MRINQINLYFINVSADFTYVNGVHREYPMAAIELISGKIYAWGESDLRADPAGATLRAMAAELVGPEITGPSSALNRVDCNTMGHYTALSLAREGLSIALYDLFGQALGASLALLLGGRQINKCQGMPVVDVGTPDVMARRAQRWVKAGYRYLKIKYRGDRAADLAALRAIRKVIGPAINLQVDSNFGYKTVDQAVAAIHDLEPCGVDVVEDFYDGDLRDFRRIREAVKPKVMIDYQSYWPNIHEVAAHKAADIVNLHPKNQGGLDIAMKNKAVADAAGMETAIGSMYLLGIGNAAFQQLAGVIGGTRPCEDIGYRQYIAGPVAGEYKIAFDPTLTRESFPIVNGDIMLFDAPGLGVAVDQARAQKLAAQIIEVR